MFLRDSPKCSQLLHVENLADTTAANTLVAPLPNYDSNALTGYEEYSKNCKYSVPSEISPFPKVCQMSPTHMHLDLGVMAALSSS